MATRSGSSSSAARKPVPPRTSWTSGWSDSVCSPSNSRLHTTAFWNTTGAAGSAPAGTIYLRKTFTVTDPSTISSAILRVNGDDGEIAYVNGTQVTSSPGNVDNAWQISQVADIKSLLVAGTNVIAIAGLNSAGDASGIIAAAGLCGRQI